ncbi:MAG: DUF4330 family protein [Clostridia bacterium]|nr:DUF4330 family protein [Clostridia bacterium]
MNETGKKRINALDILLILAVVSLIVAFFFRAEIQNLFAQKGDTTITIAFRMDPADKAVAELFAAGTVLMDAEGNEIGEILNVRIEDAHTAETLTDGTVVQVANGMRIVSGNLTAKGYVTGEFPYLNNGTMLVAGSRLQVSTGPAFAELEILSVQAQ